jgi:protein tyrosine/serine phosphatase
MGVRKAVRTYTLSAVLAATLAIPAFAQPGHSDLLSTIRISNFGNVSQTYYRGGQPKGHDFADLAALGVRTVIDLQEYGDKVEPSLVERAGMKYVRIGMSTRINPTPAQIQQFLTLVNDPASQPVYVHCAGGHHRTGVMTAIYRMVDEGWKPQQAFSEMKKFGFGADFLHPEFKKFVLNFDQQAVTPPTALPTVVAVTQVAN